VKQKVAAERAAMKSEMDNLKKNRT